MDDSFPASSAFTDETFEDTEDAEAMTAAQVLTKLEEVNHLLDLGNV